MTLHIDKERLRRVVRQAVEPIARAALDRYKTNHFKEKDMVPTEIMELAKVLFSIDCPSADWEDALNENRAGRWIGRATKISDALRAKGISLQSAP